MTPEKDRRYDFENGWGMIFKEFEMAEQDLLRSAQLPLDLFQQKSPSLTGEEIYRLCRAVDEIYKHDPTYLLRRYKVITLDSFSPPIFACLCSQDLKTAVQRLTHYKPIVGPFQLEHHETKTHTSISISGLAEYGSLPTFVVLHELLFWVTVARTATRSHIAPIGVETAIDIPQVEQYEAYMGVSIKRGESNHIIFSAEDVNKPFLSPNPAMWSIFEPALQKRMADLTKDDDYRTRVRVCLNETLASGGTSITDVAAKLSMSSRTLQRRLNDEGTSFQQILDELREELALYYLKNTEYSSHQIAFLLGYNETASFFRGFRAWTGQTPEVVRAST